MREAMNAVVYNKMSARKAAEMYGIPRSTLRDRVSGDVLPGAKSGPHTLLTAEEEQQLVWFLCNSAVIGYGRTRKEVLVMVDRDLKSKGQSRSVTNGWWVSFCRRHPEVSLRTPATISTARAKGSCPEAINQYFDMLQDTLDEYNLHGKPSLIYNMDETGFPLDPKPLKIVHVRGEKNPSSISSGKKSQVTVVGCVSASGQCIPPMVVWDRKTLSPDLAVGEVPGTIYGLSKKGWMDSELFHLWFQRHFLRYAPAVRPLLLLLDGHSSHYCPETIRLAAEENVVIFTLPPNTTHLTQPLDKGVFGPFKGRWKEVCHDFLVSHPGQVVTRYNFSRLFSRAWMESMTCSNIMAGFRKTGVYPLNRNAVKLPGESTARILEKSDLTYIPLFTPAKRHIEKLSLPEAFPEEDMSTCGNSDSFLSESPISTCDEYQPSVRQNSLVNIVDLHVDIPKYELEREPTNTSERVLTSAENLMRLEEKQREKDAKLAAKQHRKQLREERAPKKARKTKCMHE